MKTILISTILYLITLMASCEKSEITPQSFDLGDTLLIHSNKTLRLAKSDVYISMDSVLEDSRCPLAAHCVWEGNASVRFLIVASTSDSLLLLNTAGFSSMPNDASFKQMKVTLLDVIPQKQDFNPIPQQDYACKLILSEMH